METNVVMREAMERENRIEELMDRALEHKLSEYESRVALIENELSLVNKQLNELKASEEIVKSDSQNLHSETLRRFVEFGQKLEEIAREVKLVEQSLHSEEKAVEKIRDGENAALSNLKSWERKTIANLKKGITAKKTLDAVLKKLLRGEHGAKLDNAVKTAGTSTKARAALVNAVLGDKKLKGKLVNEVLSSTRGKLRKERVTTKMAEVAEKKVLKTVKPKVRRVVKIAAKKAVKTEAAKV